MFQMGSIGPMLGQVHHFRNYAPEKIEYAINRYVNEGKRLFGVLDKRLKGRTYVCDRYSIADMAILPWVRLHEGQGIPIDDYPSVKSWIARLEKRPAVKRGLAVLADRRREGPMSEKAKEILFGKTQYQRR
jgi:GST-like protein